MQIKKISKEREKLVFTISQVNLPLVNAIRRTCTESVPVLAIDTVEFKKNDSVLYDEVIAHRLGLVPLQASLRSLRLGENCTCKGKGCAKCTVTFKLKVKGKEVLSTDLKSKSAKPAYEMPITKLMPNQELELAAEARLGVGKEHAKFIPGLVYHTYVTENPAEISEDDNVKFKEDEFLFHIESWGQMKPGEIFLTAIDVLSKKLKAFDKVIGKA